MVNKEPRGELAYWVRARRYRVRALDSLQLAKTAMVAEARDRYLTIAQHYENLAETEERAAKQTRFR
jgi:hypothetical protein